MTTSHGEYDFVKATVTPSPEQKKINLKTVKTIYKALRDGDTKKLSHLIGTELEWWYHGPHHCQYMMEMLTGKSTLKGFKFKPRRMKGIGDSVIIVEGWEEKGEYWVHLWRFKEGVIAQMREYFNTLITLVVRDYEGGGREATLWRSTSRARLQVSLPDLVLAL